MEKKHMPFGESRKQACMYKLVAKETKKGASCFHSNRTWVGCAVAVVCICSIVVNVVMLMMYVGLHREVEKQRVEINKINAFISEHDSPKGGDDKLQTNSGGHWSKLRGTSGHSGDRQKNGGRRRRHLDDGDQRIQPRPVTQLKGIGNNNSPQTDEGYLLWQSPRPGTFSNSFDYEFIESKVKSIRIIKSGIYYVFSKVAINGKAIENTDISECGHDVIKTRGSGNSAHLLMKSVITQDREGQFYPRMNVGSGRSYPLDTQAQGGVFHLRRNDKLRVRISVYCQRYARISMNETYTNFGAFLINEM